MEKSKEREKSREYFEFFLSELPYRDLLDLFLIFIGQRPSCLIMNLEEKEIEKIKDFCEKNEFSYIFEQGQSKLSSRSAFITNKENRMDLLEKNNGRFCGYTDIAVGKFLDFPEEDVRYFSNNIEEEKVEPEARRKAKEMIESEELSQENLKHLEVASYVPKPEEENIKKCVEKGSEYIKAIEKYDEKNNSDLGREILSRFLNNH